MTIIIQSSKRNVKLIMELILLLMQLSLSFINAEIVVLINIKVYKPVEMNKNIVLPALLIQLVLLFLQMLHTVLLIVMPNVQELVKAIALPLFKLLHKIVVKQQPNKHAKMHILKQMLAQMIPAYLAFLQ